MSIPLQNFFRQVRFQCDAGEIPSSFSIVTACNPEGVNVSDEENSKADQALKQAIDEAGFSAFRVTGGNFDFSHAEPGWGISCCREEARALSVQFRQLAFFEVRNWQVFLLDTDPSAGDEEDLGDWNLRVDDGEPCCPFCFARVMQDPCDHLLTTFDSWGGSWTLEECFRESIYDDLAKGGLIDSDDDESLDKEIVRSKKIHEIISSVAVVITHTELNQGPGFSSELQFLWVRDSEVAMRQLRKLLAEGGESFNDA
jgi:hypothetical protein